MVRCQDGSSRHLRWFSKYYGSIWIQVFDGFIIVLYILIQFWILDQVWYFGSQVNDTFSKFKGYNNVKENDVNIHDTEWIIFTFTYLMCLSILYIHLIMCIIFIHIYFIYYGKPGLEKQKYKTQKTRKERRHEDRTKQWCMAVDIVANKANFSIELWQWLFDVVSFIYFRIVYHAN